MRLVLPHFKTFFFIVFYTTISVQAQNAFAHPFLNYLKGQNQNPYHNEKCNAHLRLVNSTFLFLCLHLGFCTFTLKVVEI